MLPIKYIFMSPIPKIREFVNVPAQQSFHFQKITGTSKMNTFFKNLLLLQRTIAKKKIKIIFCFVFAFAYLCLRNLWNFW